MKSVVLVFAGAMGILRWSMPDVDAAASRIALDRVTASSQSASDECVRFQSPPRLAAGQPFRASLPRGLEFRLSTSWSISVGPINDPQLDYLWLVSPPIQTAPHRIVGPGYGLTARESAAIERPLRFVVSRADYDAAKAALDLRSASETLTRMDHLGRGRLSFVITDFKIRSVTLDDGRPGDAFEWIAFTGEACVPARSGAGGLRTVQRQGHDPSRFH